MKKVLRQQQVKPHWMFALDNLLRQAVQDAITVLLPGIIHSLTKAINRHYIFFTLSSSSLTQVLCAFLELKLQLQSSFEVEECCPETDRPDEEPNAESHNQTNGLSHEPQHCTAERISARLPNCLSTSCTPLSQEFISLCQETKRYPKMCSKLI